MYHRPSLLPGEARALAHDPRDDGRGVPAAQTELPLFAAVTGAPARSAAEDEIRAALADLDPDELSPRAALEVLYRLRRLLDGAQRG